MRVDYVCGNRCYGPETLLMVAIGSMAVSAGGSIMGGMSANKSAQDEAALQREQGDIALAEANANATNEAYNQTQFVQKQRLAFLANGVSLEGSPLKVLEASKNYGQDSVNAILSRGQAQRTLAYKSADITKNKGRAALIGGFTDAIGTIGRGTLQMSQAGMFDPTKKTFKPMKETPMG